jgi:hypothetical protein
MATRLTNRQIDTDAELDEIIDLFAYLLHQRSDISLSDISKLAGHADSPGWADKTRKSTFRDVKHGELVKLRKAVHKLKKGEDSSTLQLTPTQAREKLLYWTGKHQGYGNVAPNKPIDAPPPIIRKAGRKSRAIPSEKISEMVSYAAQLINQGVPRDRIAVESGFNTWRGFYRAVHEKGSTTPEKHAALVTFYQSLQESPTETHSVEPDQAVETVETVGEVEDSHSSPNDVEDFNAVAEELRGTLWNHIEKLDMIHARAKPFLQPAIAALRDTLMEYHDRMFTPTARKSS